MLNIHEILLAFFKSRAPLAISILIAFASASTLSNADAATASAKSARGYAGDQDESSSWFASGGAGTATITWDVPIYSVDGISPPHPGIPFSESKFGIGTIGLAIGRQFTGFNILNRGPKGSLVHASGSGSSEGTGTSVIYTAAWYVVADGTAAPGGGSFSVKTTGKDPWNILNSDVSRFSGGSVDLYIPFSMTGGSFDTTKATSSFGFNLGYENFSGYEDILNVNIDKLGVTVDGPSTYFDDVKFYISTGEEYLNPMSGTTHLISISELKTIIQANVVDDSFAHAINIGVVLGGLSVPDSSLSNTGIFAKIHADSVATEGDTTPVPEPSSSGAILSGLGVLAALKLRRRA